MSGQISTLRSDPKIAQRLGIFTWASYVLAKNSVLRYHFSYPWGKHDEPRESTQEIPGKDPKTSET